MSQYFTIPVEFVPGTLIKAEEFNTVNQALEAGFESIEFQIDRTIRLPNGISGEIANGINSRALRVIGFDQDGNIQLRSSFQFVGDWMTGQLYLQNQIFRDPVSKNLYTVNVEHTSTTIAADLTAQKIVLAINVQDVTDARDGAIQAAQEAFESGQLALGYKNETFVFRNESEVFRDQAEEFALTAINAPGTSATSMTSHTLNLTSPKTFTIQTGKAFAVGQFVIIASAANPANYFVGQIQMHNPMTGSLTVTIVSFGGSGTFSDWVISLTAVANGAVTIINVSANQFYRLVLTGDAGSDLYRGVNPTQNLDYNPTTGNLRTPVFTGNLVGNADTATLATNATNATNAVNATNATNSTNVNVTTSAANAEYPIVLAPNQTTGQKALLMDSAGGTYNPSTNTATINITGNAATATSANTANTATSATSATSATNATNTTNVNVTTSAANASYPFVLAPSQTTGQQALLIDSSSGTYNPATNTADINISGNAATVTNGVYNNGGTYGINITGNAETVDGFSASQSTVGNAIVVRDGNGYIFGNYINMSDDGNPGGGTAISSFITKLGDNYYRSVSPANAMASIRANANGTWAINITGNAETVDGYSASIAQTPNTAVVRDASGFTYHNYINSNTTNSENPSISQVIVTNGDNFYRKASVGHLTASLSGTAPINITGNAATATTAQSVANGYVFGTASQLGSFGLFLTLMGALAVDTVTSGANLIYSDVNNFAGSAFSPPGTWRLHGAVNGSTASVWHRIA